MDYEELILSELKFADKVTRKRLCQLTGLDDRTNREIIEQMRMKYIPVISTSSTSGYWLAKNRQECRNFAREQLSATSKRQTMAFRVNSTKAEKYYKKVD